MTRHVAGVAFGLTLLANCAGAPGPAIPVWDHPTDVRHCRLIDRVSGLVRTEGGFGAMVDQMVANTVAIGGTDLLLRKQGHDWSLVVGEAYRCGPGLERRRPVLSVKY